MNKPEFHLGGQEAGNVDKGIVDALCNFFGITSLVDIGCGNGEATRIYADMGIDVTGVDGDWTRLPNDSRFILHDFTKGVLNIGPFDLAYSIEFLEHLHEEYLPNVMPLFAQCNYAVVTAALPGQKGHHHVNCRKPEYWHDVFRQWNLYYDDKVTQALKKQSTMQKASGPHTGKCIQFFKRTGMFFRKIGTNNG